MLIVAAFVLILVVVGLIGRPLLHPPAPAPAAADRTGPVPGSAKLAVEPEPVEPEPAEPVVTEEVELAEPVAVDDLEARIASRRARMTAREGADR
jgi:hypothetical protein